MRGLVVGTVGTLVLLASAAGLSLDAFRAGPYDRPLEPVIVTAQVDGTYHSRSAAEGPLGACLQQPCDARTEVDATVSGLPDVPYEVRLEGPGGGEPLGAFRPDGGILEIRWEQQRDHTDKERLVLAVAGRDVATIAVRGGAEPQRLSGPLGASWDARPGVLHVNEIGGVTISSIATTRLSEAPPEGWEFRARFEGPAGLVDLGALGTKADSAVLDGRVERLRLEDHERLVILLAPGGAGKDEGFPVLRAVLWP